MLISRSTGRPWRRWSRAGISRESAFIFSAPTSTPASLAGRLQFLPRQRFEFKTRVVEPVYERLPAMMMDLKYGVQIYEVQPVAPVQPATAATLNMDFNFGFPTRGFHAVETTADGEAFRWTSGAASLELPALEAANDGVLSLSLAQDFPPALASASANSF